MTISVEDRRRHADTFLEVAKLQAMLSKAGAGGWTEIDFVGFVRNLVVAANLSHKGVEELRSLVREDQYQRACLGDVIPETTEWDLPPWLRPGAKLLQGGA